MGMALGTAAGPDTRRYGSQSMIAPLRHALVECPEEEFDTQGCNVLTLEPGVVVICAGNPVTTGRLRERGVDVLEYEGNEISVARISGPTCNTRPLLRGA